MVCFFRDSVELVSGSAVKTDAQRILWLRISRSSYFSCLWGECEDQPWIHLLWQ